MPTFRTSQISRRQFLERGAWAALAGAGLAEAPGILSAEPSGSTGANPFAYDLGRVAKTDPRLVRYEEVGQFPCPHPDQRRIIIQDDQLYLLAGGIVSVLGLDGTPFSELALNGPARCAAVGASGDLLVGLRDHVEIFDRKGQRLSSWEPPGKRTWLTGMALTGQFAFLADAGNRVVLRCSLSKGKVLNRIGERNKERGTPGFIVPSPFFDVRMHTDGLLRVTNPGRHRVEAYTPEGDFEFAWGKPSASIEGFCGCCNPVAIALLPDGRIVTAEKGLPRVKVYAADGAFECVVAGPESFPENARSASGDSPSGIRAGLDLAVDGTGRVYVLDRVAGNIHVFQRRS